LLQPRPPPALAFSLARVFFIPIAQNHDVDPLPIKKKRALFLNVPTRPATFLLVGADNNFASEA
jgi:hypothetical protein